jgi:hypothetical protein
MSIPIVKYHIASYTRLLHHQASLKIESSLVMMSKSCQALAKKWWLSAQVRATTHK